MTKHGNKNSKITDLPGWLVWNRVQIILKGNKQFRRTLPVELKRKIFFVSAEGFPIITGNPIISRRRELWEEMKTRLCWPTLCSPKEISSQVVEVCGNSTINSISCLRSRDSLSSSYIMQSLIISRALISSVLTHQSIRVVSQNTKISSSHDLAFRTHSPAEVKWVLRKWITHFRFVDIWLGDLYRAMGVSMSTIHNNNDWGNGISQFRYSPIAGRSTRTRVTRVLERETTGKRVYDH